MAITAAIGVGQHGCEYKSIGLWHAQQAVAGVHGKLIAINDNQRESSCWDERLASLVVPAALLAAVHAADGQLAGLVEVWD